MEGEANPEPQERDIIPGSKVLIMVESRGKYSDLFVEMLEDPDIGIYRPILPPDFPVVQRYRRIVFGYAEPKRQIDYMLSREDEKFELSISQTKFDWRPYVDDLCRLPNILGIEGSGLRAGDLARFPHLEELSPADNCDMVDLGTFPNLSSLAIGIENGLDFLRLAKGLRSLQLFCDRSSGADFSPISDLTNLESLYIFDGKMPNIEFLRNNRKIEILTIALGKKLLDITAIEALINLKFLRLDRLRKVSDWKPLRMLPEDTRLSVLECSRIDVGKDWESCPALFKSNHYGTGFAS
jgi:hypothetical protein